MASTPGFTSPPNPYQNNQHPSHNNFKHRRRHHNRRQSHSRELGSGRPPFAAGNAAGPATGSTPNSLPSGTSFPTLSPEFSGRRSTRIYSKLHLGRPRSMANTPHTALAEEVLEYIKNTRNVDNILLSFENELCSSKDYIYLLKELGNIGEWEKALRCFQFAMERETRRVDRGKLASNIISTLGRLGKIEIAKSIFETAFNEGYGNTVFCFSALVSAYGKCGLCKEALKTFDAMIDYGISPNLVAYNSVIDACAKGGVEFNRVWEFFNEMLRDGIEPDLVTFNCLIAVCSRVGDWQRAGNLFNQMIAKGIQTDVFTFNTYLDALCKSGQMDLAFSIMQEMPRNGVTPNLVTYSTMLDGYSKANRFEDVVCVLEEMKSLGFVFDRILYNTLVTAYGKLGRLREVINLCNEMKAAGISRDSVTYNALLQAFGKQGRIEEARRVFLEMKASNQRPNLLTYSSLVGAYLKHGLLPEALEVLREQKEQGFKPDVVLYSTVVNAACKYGSVESAVWLIHEMIKEGITPNVVTFNSIIYSFGHAGDSECTLQCESSSSVTTEIDAEKEMADAEDNQIIKVFGLLVSGKGRDNRGRGDLFCILDLVRQMHHLNVKPNVVTFSAILNACSRCNSFSDASMLLEELRVFDNRVYGVAYGLLMGYLGSAWLQALSLFDELRRMDSETTSAFYNALTDVLWHFDQRYGAQLVALEAKYRQVWDNAWSDSCLDLHLMSTGAAQAMVHAWLLSIHAVVLQGYQLPQLLSILTGWGKHSKVVGAGTLRRVIEALLRAIGAPFHLCKRNLGRFISQGPMVAAWLRESGTYDVLVLRDARTQPGYPMYAPFPSYPPLTYNM
ncbi:hypothetical protein SLEP1_g1497 [Rubroshorea leprosula]|uniref:Smr domain-containing protein n=1 Tax=Rubroshorea leprosula TaxID=152421 RepID=A0AAV5HKQ2_9ROSI|nr:hypothetical protein SLEP1_g1497 [Rubroshorea leprosula]